MDKYNLIKLKKKLLIIGLASSMIGTIGCTTNKDENGVPKRAFISSEYSKVDDYYKYVVQNQAATKFYKAENVYLLFNKDTYNVDEYIFDNVIGRFGCQLYDLENEELLVYYKGIVGIPYNMEYFNYLNENNYVVCLKDASDYVEDLISKEYYSYDEIKELEPKIMESLKIINLAQSKTR